LGLEFVAATAEDVGVVVELHCALNREMAAYSEVFPPEALERSTIEYFVDLQLGRDNFCVWLAMLDGRAVGLVSTQVHSAPIPGVRYLTGTIPNLYVLPEFRRQGVGTALVDCALARFRELGVDHVEMHYLVRNKTAQRFWTSHGFKPESMKAILRLKPPSRNEGTKPDSNEE